MNRRPSWPLGLILATIGIGGVLALAALLARVLCLVLLGG